MDDSISRQAAIDAAMRYCPDDDGTCSKADRDIRELLDELENLPSAQPERKKGRWINTYPDIEPNPMFMYGICSECGFEQSISDKLNYCPNCGTQMEGNKMSDFISRQWLMECIDQGWIRFDTEKDANTFIHLVRDIAPSEHPESLTDDEQRIFLAAMERERKVCKEMDDKFVHGSYEVLLTEVCDEIKRKVTGALWT